MRWDPDQYSRYADERGRPFFDLITRIGAAAPRRVVDLGCGPGKLTVTLAERWPDAVIDGIDSSAPMIDAAPATARVHFTVGDIRSWTPSADVDVVISNAALQWVPDHEQLLVEWAEALPRGAWLAWQVPGNFDAPSHTLMRTLAQSPRWAAQLGDVLRHRDAVLAPIDYAHLLLQAGWQADVWETTYLHVLPGADPVLEWLRGTGLRPITNALSADDNVEFEASLAALLREAYPTTPNGTLFGFRRIFAVGHKP